MGAVASLPGWNPSREGNVTELKWAGVAGMLNFDNLNMCLRECERVNLGPIRLAADHPRDVYTLLQYSGAIPANAENSFENALRRAVTVHDNIPGIRGVSSVCCNECGEIDVHYDGDFDIFKKEGGMARLTDAVMDIISSGEKIASGAIRNPKLFANRDQLSSHISESSEFSGECEFTCGPKDAAQLNLFGDRIAILKSNARNATCNGTRKMEPDGQIGKREVWAFSASLLHTDHSSQSSSSSSSSAITSSDLESTALSDEKNSAVAISEDEIVALHSSGTTVGVVQYARGSVRMVITGVSAAAAVAFAIAGLVLGAPIVGAVGAIVAVAPVIVYGVYHVTRVTVNGAHRNISFNRSFDSCNIA